MKLKITKGLIQSTITAPCSKSWANRFLMIAATSRGATRVYNVPRSTDVENLLNAFSMIGLSVERSGDDVVINNSFPECELLAEEETLEIHTGDGGTTNRFLLCLLSRGKKRYQLITSKEFRERPSDTLFSVLSEIGSDITIGENFWAEIRGNRKKIKKQTVEVDCSQSTQFLSGLLLSYESTELIFKPIKLGSSKMYLEMTKKALEINSSGEALVTPVDFSSISYPVAFISDGGKLKIDNCFEQDAYQADSILFNILKDKGVRFLFTKKGLQIDAKDFDYKPLQLSCSDFPDLVPTLVFLACLCHGKSVFTDLEVLKYKESNRFKEIYTILSKLGVTFNFSERDHSIEVIGPLVTIKQTSIKLPPDHRMVMLAAMIMKKFGQGEIDQIEHVKKSYPNFIGDFKL